MDRVVFNREAYELAQDSFLLMKKAIVRLLADHPDGLKNAEIGRALGVNGDNLKDQAGWYPWTVLKQMELEGTVEQASERGPWRLKHL